MTLPVVPTEPVDSRGAAIEEALDDILAPQIMNEDTCFECGINFKKAKQAILALLAQEVNKARIDELSTIQTVYGHYVAQTFRERSSQGGDIAITLVDRIKELEADLERLG